MHEEFQRSIAADPDNLDNYRVYADWLVEQGDPRGDFIRVQLALEVESQSSEERDKLKQREQELLDAHQREWLGDLAAYFIDDKEASNRPEWRASDPYKFEFARGFLDTVSAEEWSLEFGHAVSHAPESRSIRRLQINETPWLEEPVVIDGVNYEAEEGHGAVTLASGDQLQNLRVLVYGDVGGEDEEYANCHAGGARIDQFVAKLPRLEELFVGAHGVDTDALFELKLPMLRVLKVNHTTHYPVEKLAANDSLSNLESLSFWPHALDYDDEAEEHGAYLRLQHIEAVGRSPHLKKLRHLCFRLCNMGDAGCRSSVETGLLGRLKVLDLTHGQITDEGARVLAADDQIKNLDQLILDGNAMTKAGIDVLTATGVNVSSNQQWTYSGDEDYLEYLYYGDME